MGVTLAASRRPTDRTGAIAFNAVAIWLCGALAVALGVALIGGIAVYGWRALVAQPDLPNFDLVGALQSSGVIIGIAIPLAVIPAFLASIAGSEAAIGGATARWLDTSLRVGPATPAIAVGVAVLWVVARGTGRCCSINDTVAAAIALAAFNLPILTARFRAVIRVVPRRWRVAAIASGASPHRAFVRVVLPRAWPSILGVVLNAVGQMLGETALVALFFGNLEVAPVPVTLWRLLHERLIFGPRLDIAATTVMLLLVIIVLAFRFAARLLQQRPRRIGAPAA